MRSISYGGGVQSTALLVLAAQGRIDFPLFVFANVGKDSERAATLRYVEEYAKPYAAEHGIELAEVQRTRRDGALETLWGRLTKTGSRSIPIPVRMSNGAPGTRSCTADFKIKVVGKEMKRRGATAGRLCTAHRADLGSVKCKGRRCVQPNKATIGIGISLDEIHRANTRHVEPHEQIVYPLLELGLRRIDCARIIREAGLPVPPKSSCFFCPFHRPETWHDMRRDEPDEFEKACQLEDLLNERRDALGKDHVYLTRFNKPLRQAIPDGVDLLPMFDEADGLCDSGWCMT
ncbi:MAG: phosphoadenosine phosphosulfate reductase [Streptomyces sp.]|nr:phosphoadenosine phosphosulfate reductase [Streptomyces sp.]NUP36154.1 phosphoadenosine phosphosulfate reductase [Streptomyces sp.]NUS75501.1 phosphoadenosine phosphosulfate reductase [Streptomyces sp.]